MSIREYLTLPEWMPSSIGPLLILEPLEKALPKSKNTVGEHWVGRGKNKVFVHLDRKTRKAPPMRNIKRERQATDEDRARVAARLLPEGYEPKAAAAPKKLSKQERAKQAAEFERRRAQTQAKSEPVERAGSVASGQKQREMADSLAHPKRVDVLPPTEAITKDDGTKMPVTRKVLSENLGTPSFEELDKKAKPAKINPKTNEAYKQPSPGEKWITVHPWHDERYQHVLVREVEHGHYMSVSGMGGKKFRFLSLRSTSTSEVAGKAAEKRQQISRERKEANSQGYLRRLQAENNSSAPQSKFAADRRDVAAILEMYGHTAEGECQNEFCKRTAKEAGIPVVHLMTPEIARASLNRAPSSANTMDNAIRSRMQRNLKEAKTFARALIHASKKAIVESARPSVLPPDRHGAVPSGVNGEAMRQVAVDEAAKHLADASHAKKELVMAQNRLKRAIKDVKGAKTEMEQARAEQILSEASASVLGVEQHVLHARALARQALQEIPNVMPMPETKLPTDRLPKPDLKTMSAQESNISEFINRHDEYLEDCQKKVAEYLNAATKFRAEAEEVESGKKHGKLPGKFNAEQRKIHDEMMESRNNEKRARILSEGFARAIDFLSNPNATAARTRQIVGMAYAAESEDDIQKLISGARIRGAAPGQRATQVKMPKPKAVLPFGLDPQKFAEANLLAKNLEDREHKYERGEQAAERQNELTVPITPLLGDIATDELADELERGFKRDLIEYQASALIGQAWKPWRAIELLGRTREKEALKLVNANRNEGMFSGFHAVSVGLSMAGLVDRATVNVLGQMGTAMALAEYTRQHAGEGAIATVKAKLDDFADTQVQPKIDDALQAADAFFSDAEDIKRGLERRRKAGVMNMVEFENDEKEMNFRIAQGVKTLSYALGQQMAVNAYGAALAASGRQPVEIAIPGEKVNATTVTDRLAAIGLNPKVDYDYEKAGDQWLVKVKHESLAKAIKPTHEPIFDPQLAQWVERVKDGGYFDENHQWKWTDQPGYVPPYFTYAHVGKMHGMEIQKARDVFEGATPKSMKDTVEAAIGTLAVNGMHHTDIGTTLRSPSFQAIALKGAPKGSAEAYTAAVRAMLPPDRVIAQSRVLRAAEKVSGDKVDAQELDPLFAAKHLKNALAEMPHGTLAFKPIHLMDGVEKDTLRRYWSTQIAGQPYGERSDANAGGKSAWKYFLKQSGGEGPALEAAQDVLKDELLTIAHRYASGSGTRWAMKGKPLKNAHLLDDAAFEGPRAGIQERRSLGKRAEAQLEGIAHEVLPRFHPRQARIQPLAKPFDISSEQFVRQQRAIRILPHVKRMAVITEPASGKTVMGLGGFAELHAAGHAKRSVWMVPAPLLGSGKTPGQINGEFTKFLQPGTLTWHAAPTGSTTFEQRLAKMKDPSLGIYVTTHDTMRDDIHRLIAMHLGDAIDAPTSAAQARAGALPLDTKARVVSQRLNELAKAGEHEQIANIVHKALAHHGIEWQHSFVDESHRLSNRSGKGESQMSEAITGLTDKMPYYMAATASPGENDFSEVIDLCRKVRPDLFAKRKAKNGAELRTPAEHIYSTYYPLAFSPRRNEMARESPPDIDLGMAEALRREIGPMLFNVPKGESPDTAASQFSEEKVHLSQWQKQNIERTRMDAATARSYATRPDEAMQALRRLNPEAFAHDESGNPIDERDHAGLHKVAQKQVAAVETLRRNRIDAIIHEAPFEHNAKAQHLLRLVQHDKRLQDNGKPSSGVVFTNRIKSAEVVAEGLRKHGVLAFPITSGTSPTEVEKAEKAYKAGRAAGKQVVLVVSPTGAVGKNYQEGNWATHFDLPHSAHQLSQREGRVNRPGQTSSHLHNIRLVARGEGSEKHELEQQRERIIRQKSPLMELLNHSGASKDDTDIAHLLNAEMMLKPEARR